MGASLSCLAASEPGTLEGRSDSAQALQFSTRVSKGCRVAMAELPTANRGRPASVKPVPCDACDATPVTARCNAAPRPSAAPCAFSGLDLRQELPVEPMLQLLCTVLQAEIAVLTLADGNRLVMRKGAVEVCEPGEPAERAGVWAWAPLPVENELVTVEDTRLDERFKAMGGPPMCAVGELRFYCATPLVGASGRRLGTLCLGNTRPRQFGPGPAGVLANLTELIVHEVEAAAGRALQRQQSERLLSVMDLYQAPHMLVDTGAHRWRVLHLNARAVEAAGLPLEMARVCAFWDMFEMGAGLGSSRCEAWAACEPAAARGEPFKLHGVARRGALPGSAPPPRFTLKFRPAAPEEGAAALVGMALPPRGRPYFFVELEADQPPVPRRGGSPSACGSPMQAGAWADSGFGADGGADGGSPRGGSSPVGSDAGGPGALCSMSSMPFPGLEMGKLLGRGAFGFVYSGTYQGATVAVKIIPDNPDSRTQDGLPVEAHITAGLNHCNVVRTIAHAWRPLAFACHGGSVWDSAGSVASGTCNGEGETWLLLELCNRGTLQDAVAKHWFRQGHNPDGELDLAAVLATAAEIAAGMQYLHARGIVHGDLTGANVLLTSSPDVPHGFTAKVADFGLSREMNCKSRVETRTYGTITHMPPELLSSDVVSKGADVWAFSVLLFELVTGKAAFAGMNHAQVIHHVAILKRRLELPVDAPPALRALAERCMAIDPSQRSTFDQVKRELSQLRGALPAP
ncbi:hypothetical protein WJX81_003100 [Elliptochloris bilobata]|uniref:Protein kinase domain-containing protein n=1 Tax=Elliptochloris bilobata TaxID=381761 RepID=A0AAW1S1F4_9CHLO